MAPGNLITPPMGGMGWISIWYPPFRFGGAQWNIPETGQPASYNDSVIAIDGLVFVQGNLIIKNANANIHGVLWVNGNIINQTGMTAPTATDPSLSVFYNDQLNVPTLDVLVVQDAWMKFPPTATHWP